MSWLRDEDDMLDNEKWRRALRDGGDSALLVWYRLRAWCSRRLTDGVIPADMVSSVAEIGRSKARSRALQALIEHGLCARQAHGELTICGYLERNPSREHVLRERGRRAEAQKNRRVAANVTGHALSSEAVACSVPSHPIPSHPKLDHTHSAPEGAGGRTYSMPSQDPPKAYLDEAVMAGVSLEQARSTWEHYFGAGLPQGGVERLHSWLVKRSKERGNQTARVPVRAPPRRYGSAQQDEGVDPFSFHKGNRA